MSARRTRHGEADHGSASVLALGLVGTVLTLLLAFLMVGSAAIAAHRMRTAADLAAIAAASRGQAGDGADAACAAARALAVANGAQDCACRLDGAVAEVTVVGMLNLGPWLPGHHAVRATARAGPGRHRARPAGGDYPSPAASRYVGDIGPGHGVPGTPYLEEGREQTPWM